MVSDLPDFLSLYPKKSTRRLYRSALLLFFDTVYGLERTSRVSDEDLDRYADISIRYLHEERDHVEDLMNFARAMQGRPPGTARAYLSVVKEFMIENRIRIEAWDLKRVKRKLPKGGARTVEAEVRRDSIRSIISHMDARGRGLFLFLASSGMRIGEALSVWIDDVDMEAVPASVIIRGEDSKTGAQRKTFISGEAVEAIREWLKVRDPYLVAACQKTRHLGKREKWIDDPRLFPFSHTCALKLWTRATKKAGLYEVCRSSGRQIWHPHMLRKFFLSTFETSGEKSVGEVLAGHAGYLSDQYRRIPEATLSAAYREVERNLCIMVPETLLGMRDDDRMALRRQAEMIAELNAVNLDLQRRLEMVEGLQARMDAISALVARHGVGEAK